MRLPHLIHFAALGLLAAPVDAALTLVPLSPPLLWQRVEWRLDGAPTTTNNFDPDLIRIDARFTASDGRSWVVPAFWYQDHTRALVDGVQVLAPAGEAHWRLRFTPSQPGEYTVAVSVSRDGGPTAVAAQAAFQVGPDAPDGPQGWVRVAPDRRYFETSEGHPLRLIGGNVCWGGSRGTYDYDRWFPAMRDAGWNIARLWFAPWSMGLEHNSGTLNRYDLAAAWHADHVVDLAEACGLHLILAMDHHGMFMANDPAWGGSNNFWTRSSPYAVENGGPCATPDEFFTRDDARRLYQKRLRYLIGRYGWSTRVLSWQFFNEIDNAYLPRSALVGDHVVAWHREMGRWLRENDPYGHLVSTSLTGASDRPEYWTLPEMDFSVYHSYGEADPALHVAGVAADMAERYGKPSMIGEIGTSHLGWHIADDPYLRGFRQGLWGGTLGGSSGTSLTWWWEDVHADRVYPLYTVLRDVMARAGWNAGAWEPAVFLDRGEPPALLGEAQPGGEPFDARVPLNQLRLNPVSGSVALPHPLAIERAAEQLSAWIHGSRTPHLQQHARLSAWFGRDARMVVRVNSVAADADLLVRIDGVETLRVPLEDRDGMAALADEIDAEYAVPVPAGRHTIEITHTGPDWVNLKSLRLERLLPATYAGGWEHGVDAIGLRRGDEAVVVYVRSPHVAWPAGARRYGPPVVTGAVVTLREWRGGPATVTWIDPSTGRDIVAVAVEPRATELPLTVPELHDDLIAIVRARR